MSEILPPSPPVEPARPADRKPTADELRQLAIAEARELLAEGGPDQVKARVLAVRLGVSVGTIYNLFGQLDELLFHVNAGVYDELYAHATVALADARSESDDPVLQMLTLCYAYLDFVSDRQALWSGVLAFNRRGKSRVPQWYRERERAVLAVAKDAVNALEGPASAATRDLCARTLWAAVHGIVTTSVGRDGLIATRDDVAFQIEIIVRAVTASLQAGTITTRNPEE